MDADELVMLLTRLGNGAKAVRCGAPIEEKTE